MKLRRKVDPTNCTLLEYAYGRTGSYRKAMRVGTLVTSWLIARRDLDASSLTMDQYIEHWREKRSTAYKYREEFREVFGHDDVDQVVDAIEAQRHPVETGRFDLTGLVAA